MKVLVSGSHGLVGSALAESLQADGHTVVRLVRSRSAGADEVSWDPEGGSIDSAALERAAVDAVVHLAGENIAAGRWTPEQKARLRDSRVKGTRTVAEAIAALERPPRVLVAASAIGYYGDRGDEVLTEDSRPGTGFLAEVSRQWEAAATPAAEAGIRVVNARIGVVLSTKGGALPKLLTPFRLGVGGPFGSGKQWMSWISLDDVIAALRHALDSAALHGPVNLTAPAPIRNRDLARALGKALSRPAFLPTPAFALRMIMGSEMADALLLASQRVEPRRLTKTGFKFTHPELDEALRSILAR
jgi:uncharacterized protein (TIGR01777 family)